MVETMVYNDRRRSRYVEKYNSSSRIGIRIIVQDLKHCTSTRKLPTRTPEIVRRVYKYPQLVV